MCTGLSRSVYQQSTFVIFSETEPQSTLTGELAWIWPPSRHLGLEAFSRRYEALIQLKFAMPRSLLGLKTDRLGLGLDLGARPRVQLRLYHELMK